MKLEIKIKSNSGDTIVAHELDLPKDDSSEAPQEPTEGGPEVVINPPEAPIEEPSIPEEAPSLDPEPANDPNQIPLPEVPSEQPIEPQEQPEVPSENPIEPPSEQVTEPNIEPVPSEPQADPIVEQPSEPEPSTEAPLEESPIVEQPSEPVSEVIPEDPRKAELDRISAQAADLSQKAKDAYSDQILSIEEADDLNRRAEELKEEAAKLLADIQKG